MHESGFHTVVFVVFRSWQDRWVKVTAEGVKYYKDEAMTKEGGDEEDGQRIVFGPESTCRIAARTDGLHKYALDQSDQQPGLVEVITKPVGDIMSDFRGKIDADFVVEVVQPPRLSTLEGVDNMLKNMSEATVFSLGKASKASSKAMDARYYLAQMPIA